MKSLLKTLSLGISCTAEYTLKEISTSTFIGSGQAAEAAEYVRMHEPEEAVINALISPRQEKNL